MAQETIKFIIKQDGSVTEEVIGIIGNDCEGLTRNIEEKLGTVKKVDYKSEYYQTQIIKDNVTLHMHQDKN